MCLHTPESSKDGLKYFQRLFFVYYKPLTIINTLSEKSTPFVAPHSTVYPALGSGKQGLDPAALKTKKTFRLSESLALARKNGGAFVFP